MSFFRPDANQGRRTFPSRNKFIPYLTVHCRRTEIIEGTATATITVTATTTPEIVPAAWNGKIAWLNEYRDSTNFSAAEYGTNLIAGYAMTATGHAYPLISMNRSTLIANRMYIPGVSTNYWHTGFQPIATIETWLKVYDTNTYSAVIFSFGSSSTNFYFNVGYVGSKTNGNWRMSVANSMAPAGGAQSVSQTQVSGVLSTDWMHIAVERASAVWTLYVNGVQTLQLTQEVESTLTWGGALTWGFGRFDGRDSGLKAFFSEGRIVFDELVYGTTTFTPTLKLLDNVRLLFHFEETVSEAYAINDTMYDKMWGTWSAQYSMSNSAIISDIQSKFGTTSLRCYGGRLTSTSSETFFSTKTQDFSLDFWVYPESTFSTLTTLVDFRGDTSTSTAREALCIMGSPTGGINLVWGANGVVLSGTTTLSLSAWSHIAIERENSVLRLYINGNKSKIEATVTASNVAVAKLSIGKSNIVNAGNSQYYGFIDEFRLMLNSADWKGTSFTPRTTAYASRGLPGKVV